VATASDNDLTVRAYEADDRKAWDRLVDESRSSHFLFKRAYMEYHRDRFEDASLLVLERGVPIAAFPASRHGDEVISHGGLTFGGLLSGTRLTARRTLEAITAIADKLAMGGATRLRYKAVPWIYDAVPAEEDLYALFRLDARLVRRDCSAALHPGAGPGYSKGRRSAVRQAGESDLTIASDPAIAEFMELEAEALGRRHGVAPVHTPAEMESLATAYPDNIKLFTARAAGELLGGVLVYETPMVAHAQYIAGTEPGYEKHALDGVIDFLIGAEYAAKRWFDFGISTTEEGRNLNTGLIRNKESYGGRAVVYDTYELDLGGRR
jgi:Acetyltransferase (GNAT) domain